MEKKSVNSNKGLAIKRKFHVYIIESPSAPDLYYKRFEGEALNKTLGLSEIPSSHRLTVDSLAFQASFLVGLKEYFENDNSALSPIIHISAHGSNQGIQLTNGDIIDWQTLKRLLIPVNNAVGGGLLVCMSSCEGISGCIMAMDEAGELPFGTIVGSSGKPTWGATNIAFASFYHLFSYGREIGDIVGIMKSVSGNDGFSFITGDFARNAYLRRINQERAITTIESSIPDSISS